MSRQGTKLSITILLGLAVMGAPMAGARAQSATTDAVYQDIKTVIEDLLTKEVSHSVATHMACLSGRRPAQKDDPNAIDITTDISAGTSAGSEDTYVSLEALSSFPNTLQAIYDERYSSLKPVVVGEVSNFVADLAYQLLRAAQPSGRLPSTAIAGAGWKVLPPADAPTDDVTPTASKMQMKQADLVALMSLRATLLDHRKKKVLARAVFPAASADLPSHAPVYTPLGDRTIIKGELDICAANLGYKLATKQIASSGSPLDQDCSVTNASRDEYACDLAYALQDSLTADSQDAENYLVRALAVYVDELANITAPTQPQIAATVPLVTTALSASGPSSAAADYLAKAMSETLQAAAIQDLTPLTQLIDQWKAYRFTDGHPLSVTRLADVISGISTLVLDDCTKAAAPKACTFFKHETQVLGIESTLWPIVRLASNGDYVDATQLAIGIMFTGLRQSCTDGSSDTDACTMLPYVERFADDIVVYVVQAHADGTPTDETRSALRAATEDVIQQLSLNGGIDRTIWSREVFLPDLALRYDWSPSFVNGGPHSGRILASLPWLKVRIPFAHTNMVYSAVEVSLTDVVAPLAEQAARDGTATFAHPNLVWANLLAPRVDIDGGIPALSKHLLVGGGVTYRFVAPFPTAAATASTPAAYDYRSCVKQSTWSDCFQFGVFAKYTM
jgi:hypothetical protein